MNKIITSIICTFISICTFAQTSELKYKVRLDGILYDRKVETSKDSLNNIIWDKTFQKNKCATIIIRIVDPVLKPELKKFKDETKFSGYRGKVYPPNEYVIYMLDNGISEQEITIDNSNYKALIISSDSLMKRFDGGKRYIIEIERLKKRSNKPSFYISAAVSYPLSFSLTPGINFGENWFMDINIGSPIKTSNDMYLYNTMGDITGKQNFNMFYIEPRFGYMFNCKKSGWRYGPYGGINWTTLKGKENDLSINGANVLFGTIGCQVEYSFNKIISLYGNVEGRLAFAKTPKSSFEAMNTNCLEIKNWTQPFCVSLGVKFNIPTK